MCGYYDDMTNPAYADESASRATDQERSKAYFARLEAIGYVEQGEVWEVPVDGDVEWCDRHSYAAMMPGPAMDEARRECDDCRAALSDFWHAEWEAKVTRDMPATFDEPVSQSGPDPEFSEVWCQNDDKAATEVVNGVPLCSDCLWKLRSTSWNPDLYKRRR